MKRRDFMGQTARFGVVAAAAALPGSLTGAVHLWTGLPVFAYTRSAGSTSPAKGRFQSPLLFGGRSP